MVRPPCHSLLRVVRRARPRPRHQTKSRVRSARGRTAHSPTTTSRVDPRPEPGLGASLPGGHQDVSSRARVRFFSFALPALDTQEQSRGTRHPAVYKEPTSRSTPAVGPENVFPVILGRAPPSLHSASESCALCPDAIRPVHHNRSRSVFSARAPFAPFWPPPWCRVHGTDSWLSLPPRPGLDRTGSQAGPFLPPSSLRHRPDRPVHHPRLHHGRGTSLQRGSGHLVPGE